MCVPFYFQQNIIHESGEADVLHSLHLLIISNPYITSPEMLSSPPATTLENPHTHHLSLLRRLDSISSMPELHQHHSQLLRLGLSSDNNAVGRLLRFSALSPAGDLSYALRLSLLLPSPDPFIFNTLLRSPSLPSPLPLYSQMLFRAVQPNQFTFPSLLKSLSSTFNSRFLNDGRQVHSHVFKLGFHPDSFSQNNLIGFYFACGVPADARRVFDKMLSRDVVSWTTMIVGLCGFGLVDAARKLFNVMPERNLVSWNAMISGYVKNECFAEAFEVFDQMMREGIWLDRFGAASMLAACTGLLALSRGEWIHAQIEWRGIDLDSKLASTVIDMYCKCGRLEKAYEVFDGLPTKWLSSWNCMIGGLAVHGHGEEAIKLFKAMEEEMVKPDDITLLNVLSACAHSGMVDQGRQMFKHMIQVHGIEPKIEHFGCLVDLLGRAGLILDAKKVIDEMPMEPDASTLGALLGACKIHGNIDLGEQIGRRVIELDSKNSGRYILLANLYASSGRWDDVAKVRRLMNDRGVKKEAGWSMIEKDGAVSKFIAGGKLHPEATEIYAMVDEMIGRIKMAGYVPETDAGILHEIEDAGEEMNPVFFHSEKLAIAFGILHTEEGGTIRISKNLRVCRDCHEASKLISKVYGREIIVRDRSRFHHFRGGMCSCHDYW